MHRIVTCLWFDGRVEEALEFYTAAFADSRVLAVTRYGEAGPGPVGEAMTAAFELTGQQFIIINGGPGFPHSPAMSLTVNCRNQTEVDEFWKRLSDGGSAGQCGWLTDRFGVSWQVVPTALQRMLQDADAAKVARVTRAMLAMGKLEISELEAAYDGG